jgi:hypothetical protein
MSLSQRRTSIAAGLTLALPAALGAWDRSPEVAVIGLHGVIENQVYLPRVEEPRTTSPSISIARTTWASSR